MSRYVERLPGAVDHGLDFEDGVTALVCVRALRRWPDASVATNAKGARCYDDVLVLPPPGAAPALLVQLKHKYEPGYCMSKRALGVEGRKSDKESAGGKGYQGDQGVVADEASQSGNTKATQTDKPIKMGPFNIQRYFNDFKEVWDDEEFWRKLGIDRENSRFVLYTNAKIDPALERGTRAEEQIVSLLNTGMPGQAHYLKREAHPYITGELVEEFLACFIIFSEQAHADGLPFLLHQELATNCGLVDGLRAATKNLLVSVQTYNRMVGSVPCLNAKSDCYKNLQHFLLSTTRLVHGLNMSTDRANYISEDLKNFYSITKNRVTVAVFGNSCLQLRSCIASQAVQTAFDEPFFLADEASLQDAVDSWLYKPSTLVLDEDSLPPSCNLQVILSDPPSPGWRLLVLASAPGGWLSRAMRAPVIEVNVTFGQLDDASRTALQSRCVSVQGASPQPIEAVAPTGQLDHLGADVITLLLQTGPPLPLGRPSPPPPLHYLLRTLSAHFPIAMAILKDPKIKDKFIVVGMTEEELVSVVQSKEKISPPSTYESFLHEASSYKYLATDSHASLPKLNCNVPVHYLQHIGGQLYILESLGDQTALFRYLQPQDAFLWRKLQRNKFSEERILEGDLQRVTLSAGPGLGKSSLLLTAALRLKQMRPHWWVVVLHLKEFCDLLKSFYPTQESVQQLLELVALGPHPAPLEVQLLRTAVWQTGNCAVFVDAFDEVAPHYLESAKALVSVLVQSPVKMLWVATRPETKGAVEEVLGVRAFDLAPLTEGEQLDVITRIWQERGLPDTNVKEKALEVLRHFTASDILDKGTPITGSPLVVSLLARATLNRDASNQTVEVTVAVMNIFEIYNKVIESTFLRLHKDKQMKLLLLPATEVELQKLKDSFFHKHYLCALKVFLTPEEFKNVLSPGENFDEVLKHLQKEEEKTGLIVGVASGEPRFVHHSFVEFLVAKWLAEHYTHHKTMVTEIYTGERGRLIRNFFENALVEGHPLHTSILKRSHLEKVLVGKHYMEKDKGGRLPLHLAAEMGDEGLVEHMVALGAPINERDDVLQMRPLHYALLNSQWHCAHALVELYKAGMQNGSELF